MWRIRGSSQGCPGPGFFSSCCSAAPKLVVVKHVVRGIAQQPHSCSPASRKGPKGRGMTDLSAQGQIWGWPTSCLLVIPLARTRHMATSSCKGAWVIQSSVGGGLILTRWKPLGWLQLGQGKMLAREELNQRPRFAGLLFLKTVLYI